MFFQNSFGSGTEMHFVFFPLLLRKHPDPANVPDFRANIVGARNPFKSSSLLPEPLRPNGCFYHTADYHTCTSQSRARSLWPGAPAPGFGCSRITLFKQRQEKWKNTHAAKRNHAR